MPIPSPQVAINVAWETVKAYWPENSPCMELIRQKRGAEGENDNEMATMAEEGYQQQTGEIYGYQ